MFDRIKEDIATVKDKDPAASSKLIILLTYSGVRAMWRHRRAAWFHNHGMIGLARIISQGTKKKTGIEIHPAAVIGRRVFIDHGAGVVVGETAIIGNDVVIYQGVTLGGTGKEVGKRHPTIEDGVMLSSGAKVLGPVVIGQGSKIGAGSVVLKKVPPYSTVVGVPGRIVKQFDKRVQDLDQIRLPDPIMEEFKRLHDRIAVLEHQLGDNSSHYSFVIESDDCIDNNEENIETKIGSDKEGIQDEII